MTLRVDILANRKASFVQPIAEGLVRMLRQCGADPRIHYDGLGHLMRRQSIDASSLRALVGSTTRLGENRREFNAFVEDLQGTDVIVVVAHVPGSFSPGVFPNVEVLRRRLPRVPIVNYDLVYLPVLDSWSRFVLRNERTNLSDEAVSVFDKGKFGLERYDWYLIGSVGSYVPMPPGPQPYSLIGIDIDDGTLYPDQQGEFRILVDFPREQGHYPKFRTVQLEALRIAGLEYQVLEGRYSREEIRAIYRRSSLFLLSFAESFGLPIAEVQACGGLIFLADPHWACAHWLKSKQDAKPAQKLSPNFVLYPNDPEGLAAELQKAAHAANPQRVRETFLQYQPELFRGDRTALEDFLARVRSGMIHSSLHLEHSNIGKPGTESRKHEALQEGI